MGDHPLPGGMPEAIDTNLRFPANREFVTFTVERFRTV